EQTLALVPDHNLARENLAILKAAAAERSADRLAASGSTREALDEYARALAFDPKRAHARAARGMLLTGRGQLREAALELRKALDAGVKNEEVSNALAFALSQTGEVAQAVDVLSGAMAAHPESVNLKHNLARLLATAPDPDVRDGPRALRLALEVCEQTADRDPRALDTLAAAYAAAGRVDVARATAVHAAALARPPRERETAAQLPPPAP